MSEREHPRTVVAATGDPRTSNHEGAALLPDYPREDVERFEPGSLVLLGPAFAMLLVLFLIPAVYAFYLGLTNLRLVGPEAVNWTFTGTRNLQRMAGDSTFVLSAWLTLLFVVGSLTGVIGIGLALAMLLQAANRVTRIAVGAVVVVAWMMPAITAGMTWYASTTAGGTFATLFGDSRADYLHAIPILIVTLANIWSQTGFAMLVLGAALRNIPREVLEAATMENASGRQRFWRVTLPLLGPTIMTTVLLVVLISLANFALIYIMTQGGPGDATNILPLYSYQQAFQFSNLGYGALIGNAMVVLAAIFGALYVRSTGRGA